MFEMRGWGLWMGPASLRDPRGGHPGPACQTPSVSTHMVHSPHHQFPSFDHRTQISECRPTTREGKLKEAVEELSWAVLMWRQVLREPGLRATFSVVRKGRAPGGLSLSGCPCGSRGQDKS